MYGSIKGHDDAAFRTLLACPTRLWTSVLSASGGSPKPASDDAGMTTPKRSFTSVRKIEVSVLSL